MEPSPHLGTTSDLELRAGRIADPNIGMSLSLLPVSQLQILINPPTHG